MALPAFLPHSLVTLVGIFVIAAIEGWFLMRGLNLRYGESYRHALSANWMSTICGIPLAWLIWMAGLVPMTKGLIAIGVEAHPLVEATLLRSALAAGGTTREWMWMDIGSAVAWLVLLVPFWMGSVWIERRTIGKRLPEFDAERISRAVIRGNLASYSVFFGIGLIALTSAIKDLPNSEARYKAWLDKRDQLRQQHDVIDVPTHRK